MCITRIINNVKYLAFGIAAAALLASCDSGSGSYSAKKLNLADTLQATGYMLGRDMGRTVLNMRKMVDFDNAALVLGLREALDGAPSLLSDSALRALDEKFKMDFNNKRIGERQKAEDDALQAANAFLEANKSKEGVIVTESGLQYVVLTQGAGKKPTLKDTVKVHYHGTLLDGTVFDSSIERGQPAVFPVDKVIPGWVEVLQLMPVGSKYKVIVPPDLAYGSRGTPPPRAIAPNAVLIFEMELLEIKSGGKEKAAVKEKSAKEID